MHPPLKCEMFSTSSIRDEALKSQETPSFISIFVFFVKALDQYLGTYHVCCDILILSPETSDVGLSSVDQAPRVFKGLELFSCDI